MVSKKIWRCRYTQTVIKQMMIAKSIEWTFGKLNEMSITSISRQAGSGMCTVSILGSKKTGIVRCLKHTAHLKSRFNWHTPLPYSFTSSPAPRAELCVQMSDTNKSRGAHMHTHTRMNMHMARSSQQLPLKCYIWGGSGKVATRAQGSFI